MLPHDVCWMYPLNHWQEFIYNYQIYFLPFIPLVYDCKTYVTKNGIKVITRHSYIFNKVWWLLKIRNIFCVPQLPVWYKLKPYIQYKNVKELENFNFCGILVVFLPRFVVVVYHFFLISILVTDTTFNKCSGENTNKKNPYNMYTFLSQLNFRSNFIQNSFHMPRSPINKYAGSEVTYTPQWYATLSSVSSLYISKDGTARDLPLAITQIILKAYERCWSRLARP